MIEVWRSYHGKPNALLSQDLAQEMLTRQIEDFGLGVSLPSAGVFRFQHSGGNAGYRCFMVLSVVSPDGVVIMTNSDSGEPLIREIFDVNCPCIWMDCIAVFQRSCKWRRTAHNNRGHVARYCEGFVRAEFFRIVVLAPLLAAEAMEDEFDVGSLQRRAA